MEHRVEHCGRIQTVPAKPRNRENGAWKLKKDLQTRCERRKSRKKLTLVVGKKWEIPIYMTKFTELYRELTAPRDFNIPLNCPDCGETLLDYKCQKCKHNRKVRRAGLAALGISVKLVRVIIAIGGAVFFSIIGTAIFGQWGGIFGAMLGLGGIGAAFAAPIGQLNLLSLAKRFQSKKDTYDQAAVCYFRWVIDGTMVNGIPSEFYYFLRDYKLAAHANTELRDALFDAFLAEVCGLRFEFDKWYLLDHAFTGSPRQKEILGNV